jgi:hypothetical protein
MRTPRGLSGTLKSLHRNVSTSDVLFVTRRHTRVGIRVRPMCCPSVDAPTLRSAEVYVELTCESEDPASPCR